MIPAPREEFETVWNGATWRAHHAPAPAPTRGRPSYVLVAAAKAEYDAARMRRLYAKRRGQRLRARAARIGAKKAAEAARLAGNLPWRVAFRHLLPNSVGPLLAFTSINAAVAAAMRYVWPGNIRALRNAVLRGETDIASFLLDRGGDPNLFLADAALKGHRDIVALLLDRGNLKRRNRFNRAVEIASTALVEFCQQHGALYIDTCIEPWPGGYTDPSVSVSRRSNYALRETLLKLKPRYAGGPTAVIAHPIRTAPTSALAAMFCGREKMPPPIIEPTTRAVSAPSRSFWLDSWDIFGISL